MPVLGSIDDFPSICPPCKSYVTVTSRLYDAWYGLFSSKVTSVEPDVGFDAVADVDVDHPLKSQSVNSTGVSNFTLPPL